MIHCKPKRQTYFSLSFITLLLLVGLVFLLRDFAVSQNFPFLFYLIGATVLTVVILLLVVKILAGMKFIAAGANKIVLRWPVKNTTKTYTLQQVLAWEEEVVQANKREFRQLTLAFQDHFSIQLSNHEHEGYSDFVMYLQKKCPKARVKPKGSPKGN
ncbi:MAG: hypothetical protein ACXIT9_10545 [Nitritalea sp.]